ncbi:hypothetical protein LL946_16895 [Knoellia locipacati]|uniref:hypothetical protein n=1 Tax=Knoellia locipacati TaxID=882824 RepID=UPI00384F5A73
MNTASGPRAPRGSLVSPVVLVGLALLWATWALWFVLSPDRNPGGQCEGLGFGCTLTPRDLAAFVGLIGLAPLSVLVLVVTLVVRLVRINRGSSRTVWDVVVGALLLAAACLWLAGTIAGAF